MAQWLDGQVVRRVDWNDHLFSIQMAVEGFPAFTAGQFTKFGFDMGDGKVLSRPYSLVNAPDEAHIEILAVPVEEGALSPKLHDLQSGDSLKVMSPCTGFLTLDEVPQSKHIWLIATGTGVGPFISIMRDAKIWQQYEQVVLVYGARFANDLAYLDQIEHWQQQYPERFRFVPVVSRETLPDALHGRIPILMGEGLIEGKAGLKLNAEDSQVMLCGNPDMIQDAMVVLGTLGLKKHLRRSPGQITMERYW